MAWRRTADEDAFATILSDVSFACLGVFVIFLVVLLMFFRSADVGAAAASAAKARELREALERKISRNAALAAVYARQKERLARLAQEQEAVRRELEGVDAELEEARTAAGGGGMSADEIVRRERQAQQRLLGEIEKVRKEYNIYRPVSDDALELPFSVRGTEFDWHVELEGRPVDRALLKAFLASLNRGSGVVLRFVPSREIPTLPDWVREYFAGEEIR